MTAEATLTLEQAAELLKADLEHVMARHGFVASRSKISIQCCGGEASVCIQGHEAPYTECETPGWHYEWRLPK
jgi:hypothetical protein